VTEADDRRPGVAIIRCCGCRAWMWIQETRKCRMCGMTNYRETEPMFAEPPTY
jgi:uncharacterized Fe-S cluster-containing MiaB family protein